MIDTIEQLYKIFRQHHTVTTDSRKIISGAIFFALKGENFDGNKFASAALEAGAEAVVIDNKDFFKKDDKRYFLVENTLNTLQCLARLHRRTVSMPVLAITGSNGKTTTKELTAAVLSKKYKHLCFTQGNLNNHIGVPLTLLTIPSDCDMAIIEMGASACGEISLLCSIAEPNYGIITNIGSAHLEGFGGPEGIKKGKGELFNYLATHGGTAFIRTEDTTLIDVADKECIKNRVFYSSEKGNNYKTHLIGNYNRFNIAAATAIGEYFGIDETSIKKAIESYRPTNSRSEKRNTKHNTLIVDCYNANPSSMRASIENFSSLKTVNKKVMILGDMLELGKWSLENHKEIINIALNTDCKQIYLVGANFKEATSGIQSSKMSIFDDCEKLCEELKHTPLIDCTVLIKGSHSIGLERCIPLL